MSGTHKYPTISFRISPRERDEIEAKIFVSGMKKKDYFVRSCIYNRVCVVGKKETVYEIVEKLQEMENSLLEIAEQLKDGKKEYYQVAYYLYDQRVIEREFGVYANIPDNYPKYVISMDKMDFSREGVIHLNAIKFLSETV